MRAQQKLAVVASGVGLALALGCLYALSDHAFSPALDAAVPCPNVTQQCPRDDRRECKSDQGRDEFTFEETLSGTIVITNGTMKQPGVNWMAPGEAAFRGCPNLKHWMKCTYDPDAYKIWNKSEAVIFHGRHLTKDHPVPKYRPPRQKWIFFESEPPPQTWNRVRVLHDVWGQFNFTTTYVSNSDLPYSYYKLVCHKTPDWKPLKVNFAQNKTKLAAWWVSHCISDSQREKYVEEMKKYVDVEVMGGCGKDVCSSYVEGMTCVANLLDKEFKFYLAFENSFCKDYYTEKLSKCLSINVIPVVMGLQNYSEFMPPGSYIDVRDFKSPKDLAMHLKHLDENDAAYNEYLENKRKVQCEKLDPLPYSCKLCQYLHENRQRRQIAPDARQHFSINGHCISPKMFFKGIAEGIYSKFDTNDVFEAAGTDQKWDVSI